MNNKVNDLLNFVNCIQQRDELEQLKDIFTITTQTPWHSNVLIIQRFLENYVQIKGIVNKKTPDLIVHVFRLESMINHFKIYAEFTKEYLSAKKELENDLTVTISSIVPIFANLMNKSKMYLVKEPLSLKEALAACASEILQRKLANFNHWLPLVAAYLDPFVKAQLLEISKIIPQWSPMRVNYKIINYLFKKLIVGIFNDKS